MLSKAICFLGYESLKLYQGTNGCKSRFRFATAVVFVNVKYLVLKRKHTIDIK